MRISAIGLLVIVLVAAGFVAFRSYGPWAEASHAGGADSFTVDMDPAVSVANTCSPSPDGVLQGSCTLGTVQECARMDEDDILNFDEDVTADRLQFDVTAVNVPASNPMIGFTFNLDFPQASARIVAVDRNGLLSTAPGYAPFAAGETIPDTTTPYSANMLDTGAMGTSGSGFLYRFTMETLVGATPGQYALSFISDNNHLDTNNDTFNPDALVGGTIAIGQACGGTPTPTPSPTPTPTPSPTPTPTPSPTPTPTPSPTPTPTASPTPTPTASPTPTPTASPTPTPTASPTPAPTASPTPAPTASPTPAPTPPGAGACDALAGATPNAGVAILGSSTTQVIVGTEGPDLIVTGAGRQIVVGRGGNDCIRTGADNDIVIAGNGHDEVFLGSGNDMAVGGDGDDRLNGEQGFDVLLGTAGNDTLNGGTNNNDLCIGGEGTDAAANCESVVGIP